MARVTLRGAFQNESSLASTLLPIRKFATENPRSRARGSWCGKCLTTWRKAAHGILSAARGGVGGFPLRPWPRRSNFRDNHGWMSAEDWRGVHPPNALRSLPLESAGRELSARPVFLASRVADSFPRNWPSCGRFRTQRRQYTSVVAQAAPSYVFHPG
jgi:hypothetical protein